MADYDYHSGTLSAAVNVAHFTNGTMLGNNLVLPHYGDSGSNTFTMTGVLTPPQIPSPPTPPPTPWTPVLSGLEAMKSYPGWMYDHYYNEIQSFALPSLPSFPKGQICYSTRRGDPKHSAQWHYQCDAKTDATDKSTLGFYRLTKSGTTDSVIIGGYNRITWAGSGHASDAEASIFQVSPTVFKSTAGSGPYSSYANAIYRGINYGPTYGSGHDFYMTSNMYTGYSNIGHTYKCRIGNYNGNTCRNDFALSYSSWTLAEMEMWTAEVNDHPKSKEMMAVSQSMTEQGLSQRQGGYSLTKLPQAGETL